MRIEGLDQIVKAMEQMADEIKGDPLRASLRKGVLPILNDARDRAPRDSGRLERNILSRPIPPKDMPANFSDGQEVFVRSSRRKSKDDETNAWYWRFVEFGTKFVPARPFMRPAADSKRNQAMREFTDEMRKQVERTARRVANT